MDREMRSYHFRRANWQHFLVKFYIYISRLNDLYTVPMIQKSFFYNILIAIIIIIIIISSAILSVNGILLYSLILVLIFLFLSLSNFVPSDGTTIDIFWWNTRAHYCNRNGLYVKPDSFFQTYISHVPLIMSFDVNEALEFFYCAL